MYQLISSLTRKLLCLIALCSFTSTPAELNVAGEFRLQTRKSPFQRHYLDISTTSGAIKVYEDASHSGTKWAAETDGSDTHIRSRSFGDFKGYYLTMKADGKNLEMAKSPGEGSKWRMVTFGRITVVQNLKTARFLTVNEEGKVWTTLDVGHSGVRWYLR